MADSTFTTTSPTSDSTCSTFSSRIHCLQNSCRTRAKRSLRSLNEKYIYGTIPLLHVLVFTIEMAAIAQIVRRYDHYFDKRPVLTMMITNSILNGIADTMAQTVTAVRKRAAQATPLEADYESSKKFGIEMKKLDQGLPHYGSELVPTDNPRHHLPPPFDFERLARFAGWGFIVAPVQFKWLQFLSRAFPLTKAASTIPAIKRVAADQIAFAPFGLAAFFSYMTLAEGGNAEAIKKRLGQVYVPTMKANYMLWPAVQMINFRLMPLQFQLPFASTVGIAWVTYLSLTNSATES